MIHWNRNTAHNASKNLHWTATKAPWDAVEYGQTHLRHTLTWRNILNWILHQCKAVAKKGQSDPGVHEHPWAVKIQVFLHASISMYTQAHTQITLLSHCTEFPGNGTYFLKLCAAQLRRKRTVGKTHPSLALTLMVLMSEDKAWPECPNEPEWALWGQS